MLVPVGSKTAGAGGESVSCRLGAADLAGFADRARARVLRLAATRPLHVGSALSVIDVLAVLHLEVLRSRRDDPDWVDRDRLLLSKGHAAYGLYAVLAESGVLDVDLATLPGHPSDSTPWVEAATGALGHGLSLGCGMALGLRRRGLPGRVAVVTGDGELDEGTNWEAAQFAAHHDLGNLLVVVDRNGLQQEGRTEQVLALEPLADKWRAFGWTAVGVDGHDHHQLRDAAAALFDRPGPAVLIAETIKGKGVSFMEGAASWHMGQLTGDQLDLALAELDAAGADR